MEAPAKRNKKHPQAVSESTLLSSSLAARGTDRFSRQRSQRLARQILARQHSSRYSMRRAISNAPQ